MLFNNSNLYKAGNKNAKVLPEPVDAIPTTSLFSNNGNQLYAWIGEGFINDLFVYLNTVYY